MSGAIRVVGFDPSFRNFGIVSATVDPNTLEISILAMELIKTKAQAGKTVRKNSDDLRCARQLIKAVQEYAAPVTLAIAEVPTGTQSARASWSLGIALGVLGTCPVPLIEVSPSEVKLAAVGKKTASKQEMIQWAHDKHPDAGWLTRKLKGEYVLTNDNEHLADAVAALYAGVKTEQFKTAIAMMRHLAA